MNDPNGFVQYKGEYHLFYQHHPYNTEWGPMHWGHAVSSDLVRWRHLPIALAPSESYDEGGCFSGSAAEDAEGNLVLVYTGHAPNHVQSVAAGDGLVETLVEGKGEEPREIKPHQVQCAAVSEDGVLFSKLEGNPLIGEPPAEGSVEFRDPKVWRSASGWNMVVGTAKDGMGKAVLYRSQELTSGWEYVGVVSQSDGSKGSMWECPDLFELDGRGVLLVSPMGMDGIANCTIAVVGDWDEQAGKLAEQSWTHLDYGSDYYAAQSLLDDRGRRIVIAWMDMWGAAMPSAAHGWAGSMTLPRQLSWFEDGALCVAPVEELQQLRGAGRCLQGLEAASGALSLPELAGDVMEFIAEFDLKRSDASRFGLELRRSEDGTERTVLVYERSSGRLSIERHGPVELASPRNSYVVQPRGAEAPGVLRLQVFLDRSSIEVFVNGGRAAMTARLYAKPDSVGFRLFAESGRAAVPSLQAWPLSVAMDRA